MKKRIAIIGAGMAGLTLANRLNQQAEIIIFEKARGIGGRMSTRNADPFSFDHGTQFFTARDKEFKKFLSSYLASGLVQEWKGKVITLEAGKKITDRLWFEPHYVAAPSMNSLCKKLAEGINIKLNHEVAALQTKQAGEWILFDKNDQMLGAFDLVISTAPPSQTCKLFDSFLPDNARIRQTKFLACFTLMFGLQKKWDQAWIAAKINNNPLEWIALNSSKPGRNAELTTLVVNSSNAWAEQHVDDNLQDTELYLRDQLQNLLKLDLDQADYFALHRWRYALLDKAHDDQSRDMPYYDQHLQLAAVGDWGRRSRIEDVWLDANNLADMILGY